MTATTDKREEALTFIPIFERIVEQFPYNPAVVESGFVACNYWELSQRAKKLAALMQQANCAPGDVVAISIEKSADYVCAMLAVWYCGAAFVPLDPVLPRERMALMCKEATVKVALVVSGNVPTFFTQESGISSICVDKITYAKPFDQEGNRLDPAALAEYHLPDFSVDALAYIIFTSGSTGIPKGVLVSHRGIVSFLQAQIDAFELTDCSRSLWYLSTSFDASVSDLGTALLSGAALYIEPPCRLQPGGELEEVLLQRGITYVDIPPSMLRLLPPSSLPATLKTIVIGGEACAPDVVRAFAARVKLINVYGPTESTVCTSLEQCTIDRDRPLIGRPLPGISYHVLDEDLNAVKAGQAGQLHIGGIGLARGYLNRPELTAAKFIIHPQSGERLYRTGDLIMHTDDGEYQFLGRTDRQVKLRGMLVEPEEIEAKLLQHSAVERAAVLKRPVKDGTAREILVAFVTAKSDSAKASATLDLDDLRRHLSLYLPKWMIPQKLEKLESMPLTTTGKVDLSALKKITLAPYDSQAHSNLELWTHNSTIARALAEIFTRVLGVDSVSADDDFFEIGGDSFAVVEAVVAASAMGISLSPALLMENPTIAALSATLEQARAKPSESAARTAAGGMSSEDILADLDRIYNEPSWQTLMESASKRAAMTERVPENVFFTGATGFLGSRLLYELMQNSAARLYCLVRAEDESSALGRIQAALAKHGLDFSAAQSKRIHPICGRLEQKEFDLAPDTWTRLTETVDTIVHCAALVNNLASYAELRPSNLMGTVEVARLALAGRPKCLHYAGTLSVFVATDCNSGVLKEGDHLDKTGTVYGGYAQTKWAAEMFLRKLAPLLPVSQHRLGLITGDSVSGRGADHDFLTLFVRGLLALAAVPEISQPVSVDITPVDFAARAMAALSLATMQSNDFEQATYHLANPQSLELSRLLDLLRRQGVTIETLAASDFKALLRRLAAQSKLGAAESAACLALCRLAGDDFQLFRTMDLFQATDVHFDCRNADKILRGRDIVCPPPSDELISLYLKAILAKA